MIPYISFELVRALFDYRNGPENSERQNRIDVEDSASTITPASSETEEEQSRNTSD